jgi:hypothetical protein
MQLLTLLNSFTKKILGGFLKMQKKTFKITNGWLLSEVFT